MRQGPLVSSEIMSRGTVMNIVVGHKKVTKGVYWLLFLNSWCRCSLSSLNSSWLFFILFCVLFLSLQVLFCDSSFSLPLFPPCALHFKSLFSLYVKDCSTLTQFPFSYSYFLFPSFLRSSSFSSSFKLTVTGFCLSVVNNLKRELICKS